MRHVDPERYKNLRASGKLPSLPGVALAMIELLRRDDYRFAELQRLVQSDPAIAGRLVHFANAAIFGRSRPIVSLPRALVALGSYRVRDLVVGLSIMQGNRGGACAAFDYDGFWADSLATAIACQELAPAAQIAAEELFTVGLLSRIGELALAAVFPSEYASLLNETRDAPESRAAAESQRFGFDRDQLTASLLAEWGIPESLIVAACCADNPEAAGGPDGSRTQMLARTVGFARALSRLCQVGDDERWGLVPGLLARAAHLGIGGDELSALADRTIAAWQDWGNRLQVRTRTLPPFAEVIAAEPPLRSLGRAAAPAAAGPGHERRRHAPRLHVQLFGVPYAELAALMTLIEEAGHQPVLIDDTPDSVAEALRRAAPIVIADLAAPHLPAAEICRRLRRSPSARDSFVLLLAEPTDKAKVLEAVEAGADDVLVKPVSAETLRAHLNSASRLLLLKEEISRERQDVLRSTGEFAVAHRRLLQDALTDPLTQLPNRRKGIDFLESEIKTGQSGAAPVACLMIDIDHFKRINDSLGHAAGDAVLRQLASILRGAARGDDMVFRFGGEEFAAILVDANARVALQIAERIRQRVAETRFRWQSQDLALTVSVGVAVSQGAATESAALIAAADAALYEAKDAGRNRVVMAA